MRLILVLILMLAVTPCWAADTGTIILPVQAGKLPTSNFMAIDGGNLGWRGLFDGGSTDETAI